MGFLDRNCCRYWKSKSLIVFSSLVWFAGIITFIFTIQDTSTMTYNHHTAYYGNNFGSTPSHLHHGLMVITEGHPSKVSYCNAAGKSLYETGSFQNVTFRNGTRLICDSSFLSSSKTVDASGQTMAGLGNFIEPGLIYLAVLLVVLGIVHDFLLLDKLSVRVFKYYPPFRMGSVLGTRFDGLVEHLQSFWKELEPKRPSNLCGWTMWIPNFGIWVIYTLGLFLFFCLYAFVLSLFAVFLMIIDADTFYIWQNFFRIQFLLRFIEFGFHFCLATFAMGFFPFYYISLHDEVQVDGCEIVTCSYSQGNLLANLVFGLAVLSQSWAIISRTLNDLTSTSAGFVNFFSVTRSAPFHILVANNPTEPLLSADSILKTVFPPTMDVSTSFNGIIFGFLVYDLFTWLFIGLFACIFILGYYLPLIYALLIAFSLYIFVYFIVAFFLGNDIKGTVKRLLEENREFFKTYKGNVNIIDFEAERQIEDEEEQDKEELPDSYQPLTDQSNVNVASL